MPMSDLFLFRVRRATVLQTVWIGHGGPMNPAEYLRGLVAREGFVPVVARGFSSGVWTKWVPFESENFGPNYRQIFPGEIVLETDFEKPETNREVAKHTAEILREKRVSFESWFSGNKSIHTHVWFGPELAQLDDQHRTRAKKAWVVVTFPKPLANDFDPSNFGPRSLIGMEGAPHRKTGKTKTLVDFANFGQNVFPSEIIEATKKEPVTHSVISNEKTTSNKISSCFVCQYAIENKLPEGQRNNALIPNFLALSPTDEQIKIFARTQNFNICQIEAWDSCESYEGNFNCVQVQKFAQKANLDLCSMCPRSGRHVIKN